MDWSIIWAVKCGDGRISSWGHCSVPQEQGPSARSSVANPWSFFCLQERINIHPGNQIVISFSAVNPRASTKDYVHALCQR